MLRESQDCGWPPTTVRLEAIVRFLWAGGRHPCLDVLIETPDALVGIEFETLRAVSREGVDHSFRSLLASGLGRANAWICELRTKAHRMHTPRAIRSVLLYLHAEPDQWPGGRAVPLAEIEAHRREASVFSELVAGDEVIFQVATYRDLLRAWDGSPIAAVRAHVAAVRRRFDL